MFIIKKEKIAVIEDEADILEVIDYNLSKEGYDVCSASDGLNGLNLIKKESPDLVLLMATITCMLLYSLLFHKHYKHAQSHHHYFLILRSYRSKK